jgi:SAM-dependent methyltransferase
MKLKDKKGIRLDIGCGEAKQPNWVGMDRRKVKGVDIVHDAQDFPYPFEDESCFQVLLSHLWEHIEPKNRIDLMNEIWRIMKPDGQLLISVPYYLSLGACQDPTHYTCPNEATFTYFDPKLPLYNVYKPKPWKLVQNNYSMNGNMEVILEKIKS